MDTRNDLAAVDVELFVYKLVLRVIILPIFGLVAPIFLIQQAVVEGYRLVRRTAFVVARLDLPQVEQIRFEGHGFFHVAGLVTLLLIMTFVVRYRRSIASASTQRTLPDAPGERRFRDVPASLRAAIQARVHDLWHRIGVGDAPDVLCFASTGSAACVTERDGRPAVALSTGLIDRVAKPGDRLGDAILLHELAHVVGQDDHLFRRSAAFVDAFRLTFTILIASMAMTFVASSIGEIWDFGGIEQRSPSPAAFLTGGIRELAFPYASMILILRYVALIIMLTELRADLRAAMALGGLANFAGAVRGARGFRPSSRGHLVRSWIGTKVAHLTAQERLDLLERPGRLLAPKYRYLAASIALSILLIFNGVLAFSGFDWVLQTGIIATVAALNAITVSMTVALVWDARLLVSAPRLVITAVIVVAANMLFLYSPNGVMGATSVVVTAYTDPNFTYDSGKLQEIRRAWYAAALEPSVDAFTDGRILLWVAIVFVGLLLLRATSRRLGNRLAATSAGLVAASTTVCVAGGAPFATYLLLPGCFRDARDTISATMTQYGPALPIVASTVIGVAMVACTRPKRWRPECLGGTPAQGAGTARARIVGS